MSYQGTIRSFAELTKPRIVLLVLVTAFSGMWLGAGGRPPFELMLFTMLGVGLAAASSSVLNNVIDRKRDRLMERTRQRALPSGRVKPEHALIFGLILGILSCGLLAWKVNLLVAQIALATILFYVLIYTLWLKPTTVHCTVLGGIAGALPPVMGFAAVEQMGWAAVILFGILFVWQPPHFWALALVRSEEYRNAGFRILPVVEGIEKTKHQMLLYTALLLPVSLAPYFLGICGLWYLLTASVMGLVYLWMTMKFNRNPFSKRAARRLFLFSILYLTTVYTMLFVDCLT